MLGDVEQVQHMQRLTGFRCDDVQTLIRGMNSIPSKWHRAKRCSVYPQQRLGFGFGQTLRTEPFRHPHKPDDPRHVFVHQALVERPDE